MARNYQQLIACLLLTLAISPSLVARPNDVLSGTWVDAAHPDKRVKFYKQDGSYFAKGITNKPGAEEIVFKQLKWIPSTGTFDGRIVDPDSRKEYGVSVRMTDPDTFSFKIKVFLFTRSFTFKRVKS